jgi:cation diffusion facilitator family transporter
MRRPTADGGAKQRVASLSVASNVALTGAKLVVALVTGSVSILSEALHSGLDLVAAVMALLAVRRSQEPADADHRFGHGKFESISGLIEGMLILVAVALILYTAVRKIIQPPSGEIEPALGIVVMGVSAVVNTLVSTLLFRVAKRTDSVALEADAWHLRTDVYTSVGVFVGLGVIAIGHRLRVEWIDHLDPLIAIGVALIITRAAWGITQRSWDHLVDRSLPPEETKQIEELLREHYPQVEEFHRLRTRKSGNERQIDLHLVVPGDMTVAESHKLCDHLEGDLKRLLPGAVVLIHVEPEADDGRNE